MSRFFAIGLAALTLTLATITPANAGHRHCRGYGWSYYPSYSNYYPNYTTYYYPTAPMTAATLPPAPTPASGQVAQSQSGEYRSFSDEPGQAAPATTYQAAPMTGVVMPAPASDYGTVGNPYGGSGMTIGGTPGPASNYGTAGNPYGSSGTTFGGGAISGGGTSGGTAGRPY
jgi:hypothetical protein